MVMPKINKKKKKRKCRHRYRSVFSIFQHFERKIELSYLMDIRFIFILEVKNSILCHWQSWLQREGVCKHKWKVLKQSIRNEGGGKGPWGLFEEQVSCLPATAFSSAIPLSLPSPTVVSLLLKHCHSSFSGCYHSSREIIWCLLLLNDGMNWKGNRPWRRDNGSEVSGQSLCQC